MRLRRANIRVTIVTVLARRMTRILVMLLRAMTKRRLG